MLQKKFVEHGAVGGGGWLGDIIPVMGCTTGFGAAALAGILCWKHKLNVTVESAAVLRQ